MPVTEAELTSLARSHDIITLGMAADDARRERHGLNTTFVRVARVSVEPGSPIDVPAHAGELQIVGTPASREAARARVAEVVAASSTAPVTAFSLDDLEALAARERIPLRSLLEELRAEGLELVADAPFDRLSDPQRSIEQVNIAGLALARLTIDEAGAGDPIVLYKQVEAVQRAVNVVRSFAPLPRCQNPLEPTTGYDDVRRIALARLAVQNVPSIQIDWSVYGPKLAQVALTMGADDIDHVSVIDDVALGRRRTSLEEVRRNIRVAGQEPVERDARFDPVRR